MSEGREEGRKGGKREGRVKINGLDVKERKRETEWKGEGREGRRRESMYVCARNKMDGK